MIPQSAVAVRTTAAFLALARDGRPHPAIAHGLRLLADGASVERIIVDVLAPVQRQVGELWQTNQWRTADEHAATAVIDAVLGALSRETPAPDVRRGDVFVACAEGEQHTVAARMGVELLRADGWEVTFLGGSLPVDDLQRFVAEREPVCVVVSCTIPLSLAGARRCFAAIGGLGVPALAAGAAFGGETTRALRLGASGWLGPGVELATELERSSHREAQARPIPHEAVALERERADLEVACFSRMVEQVPTLANGSPRQRSDARCEVADIVGHLITAVDLDEDEIFGSFLTWRAGMLASRGVPLARFDQSLRFVGEVLEQAGMERAARLCAAAC